MKKGVYPENLSETAKFTEKSPKMKHFPLKMHILPDFSKNGFFTEFKLFVESQKTPTIKSQIFEETVFFLVKNDVLCHLEHI